MNRTSMHSTSSAHLRQSLAAGGAFAGLGLWRQPVWALTSPGQPTVLSGSQFDLTIDSASVDFTGRRRTAMAINGSIPGLLLRWREVTP